jgi:hypothetical protein
MKKVVFLLIFAVIGVYGVGRVRLGESGAVRFLSEMDSQMTGGNGQKVCEMFHDDLEVQIADHSGESLEEVSGGKKEFCELTVATAASLNLLPHSMNVEFTEVTAKQDWLHPWTSEVSYLENRSLSILGTNVTLRTVSKDHITLVHTFSGVKLRKIRSEVYKADAT